MTAPDTTGRLWDDGPDHHVALSGGGDPMATTRRADATWSGDLLSGRGTVTAATTRVFADLPTTWASRIGEPAGVTSPEELLAAAHASCFSMACSNELAKAGTPPTNVSVSVAVTLALAVAVPAELAVTLMVCTAVPLAGIVPMVQTMVVVPLHDPCVDVGVPLSVTFAGRTMVAVVLVDGARP